MTTVPFPILKINAKPGARFDVGTVDAVGIAIAPARVPYAEHRERTEPARSKDWTRVVAGFAMGLTVAIVGCKMAGGSDAPPPALTNAIDAASTNAAKTDAGLASIGDGHKQLGPFVKPDGKGLWSFIGTLIAKVQDTSKATSTELVTVKTEAGKAAEASAAAIRDEQGTSSRWKARAIAAEHQTGYVVWKVLVTLWHWAWGIYFAVIAFGLVSGIAALWVGGSLGTMMSLVARPILHFGIPVIGGIISELLTNAHFRDKRVA